MKGREYYMVGRVEERYSNFSSHLLELTGVLSVFFSSLVIGSDDVQCLLM